MGAHPHTEYSDFIFDIEGQSKLKCDQAFERPNDEARREPPGIIPGVQSVNDHVDDGSGLRQYSNPGDTGGSHGGESDEPADPNSE